MTTSFSATGPGVNALADTATKFRSYVFTEASGTNPPGDVFVLRSPPFLLDGPATVTSEAGDDSEPPPIEGLDDGQGPDEIRRRSVRPHGLPGEPSEISETKDCTGPVQDVVGLLPFGFCAQPQSRITDAP